jgi:hypothetical protein
VPAERLTLTRETDLIEPRLTAMRSRAAEACEASQSLGSARLGECAGGADVEAEMTKMRFDALGLAPGTPVVLRPLEFGLFPTAEPDPGVAKPVVQTLGPPPAHVAAA